MARPRYHRLRVADVVAETDDARSLVFDLAADQAEHFGYRPGQFLTLRIPSDQCGSVARCYSLSSSPHTGDALTVTVKRTPEGYASNWIHDNIRPGSELDVLPPGGVFSPKSLDDDLLCVAAGSGITPVASIVKSALAHGTGRVALVYANRDERSVIFGRALAELATAQPERLVVLHWLESVQGLPTSAGLRELMRPFADREAFVCGPGPFMDAATAALRELDAPKTHVEKFVSLEGNPFRKAEQAVVEQVVGESVVAEQVVGEQVEPVAEQQKAATIEVELDGQKHTLPWPEGRRLLDVLLDAGLDAPFSCREGRCSACACVKVDGEVSMVHNEVLDDSDLAEGYILACQSLPVSDKIVISYD